MKRIFDFTVALCLLAVFSIPMMIIGICIKLSSKGPVIFWTDRVGIGNMIFKMAKFRTMRENTPALATHLLTSPEKYVTRFGRFLRRASLDELPQLFNIAKGDMSFVGPRPALFNQNDLIELRKRKNLHTVKPGLTGWAQVNGRDDLPVPAKVDFDEYYLKNRSLKLEMKILFLTVQKVLAREGVQH